MTLQEKLRWDFTLPFERAEPPPVHWFTDPEIAALAQRCIVRDSWQVVARADQLAEPGAFITAKVGGANLRVRRSDAGKLRALSTVCAHQHGILETRSEGLCKETFECPNHGAVYEEDGTLLSMRECRNIDALRAKGMRLREFPVATWGPLVAVHLGQPQEEFAEIFSPVPEWCRSACQEVLFHKRMEYPENYSVWQAIKNYLDNCSHCKSLHQRLVEYFDLSRRRCEMFPFGNVQRVPFKLSDDPAREALRSGGVETLFFWFWPNVALNFNGDGVIDVNHFIPRGPDRCRVMIDTYYHPSKSSSFRKESLVLTHRTQQEDNGACTLMQTGIEDPFADAGFYSVPNDALIHQWHQMLAKAFWRGLAAEEGEKPNFLGRCCD